MNPILIISGSYERLKPILINLVLAEKLQLCGNECSKPGSGAIIMGYYCNTVCCTNGLLGPVPSHEQIYQMIGDCFLILSGIALDGGLVTTILEGLKMIAPDTQFDFVDQGWDPRNMDPKKVAEATARAKSADLNIVVAGEYMMRFRWNDRTDGEDTDRSDIDLVGLQNELIEKVAASGKPTILILVNGRPLGVQWAAENLPAIVEAWAPGMYGGQAVAEILYGQVNPSAKLAVTIPYSVGQLQMIYNHKPSQYFHPYAAGKPSTPLYPFGHGLSYTTYKYDDLKLAQKEITKDGTVDVSVKVTNTGDRDGVEIVQLYIRDKFSSVTRPVKELKDFARVPLKAGESQVVNFKITPDKMAFYDKKMKKIVEPGEFIVMVVIIR